MLASLWRRNAFQPTGAYLEFGRSALAVLDSMGYGRGRRGFFLPHNGISDE